MHRHLPFAAALLIFAVALVAASLDHAIVFAIGPAAQYRHVAVTPALEFAAILALLAGAGIATRFVAALRARTARCTEADWVLPALTAIRVIGPARLSATIVTLQFFTLVGGESIEQRIAGVGLTGVAGLFASALGLALLVQIAVGTSFALALWAVARAACENVRAAVALVCAALGWVSRAAVAPSATRLPRVAHLSLRPLLPIANKIGSRPPPTSVSLA